MPVNFPEHFTLSLDKKAVLSQRCPRDAQSDNTHMVCC